MSQLYCSPQLRVSTGSFVDRTNKIAETRPGLIESAVMLPNVHKTNNIIVFVFGNTRAALASSDIARLALECRELKMI